MAVQNATVVKKPNTFCALTKVECILTKASASSRNHVAAWVYIQGVTLSCEVILR